MRISDWSSDVCSSDLLLGGRAGRGSSVIRLPRPEPGTLATSAAAAISQGNVTLQHRRENAASITRRSPTYSSSSSKSASRSALMSSSAKRAPSRSEEHTSELQSLMRISYAVFCLTKKNKFSHKTETHTTTTYYLQTLQQKIK